MKNEKTSRIVAAIVVFIGFALTQNTVMGQNSFYSRMKVPVDTVSNTVSFSVQVLPDANKEKFILFINNPSMEKLNIAVQTNNGTGYSETTKKATFSKRIDLTTAEDGKYVLSVSNGRQTFIKELEINTVTDIVRKVNLN
jgi:acetaldehyde dehydrogenase (acetylating)